MCSRFRRWTTHSSDAGFSTSRVDDGGTTRSHRHRQNLASVWPVGSPITSRGSRSRRCWWPMGTGLDRATHDRSGDDRRRRQCRCPVLSTSAGAGRGRGREPDSTSGDGPPAQPDDARDLRSWTVCERMDDESVGASCRPGWLGRLRRPDQTVTLTSTSMLPLVAFEYGQISWALCASASATARSIPGAMTLNRDWMK